MTAGRMTQISGCRSDVSRSRGLARCARLVAVLLLALPLDRLHHRPGSAGPRRSGRQALQRRPVPPAEQEGLQGGGQEIRGSRPPAPLFGLGAQGADHAGLRLLRGEGIRRLHQRREALRHAAPGQPGRGLCAIPDRLVLFREYPRHHARPEAHHRGDERARRGVAQISAHRIRQQRQEEDRSRARPARRQGNADRPLLSRPQGFHRRDQPFQDRGDAISDHAACRGSADAAGRGIYGARHRAGGADRGGRARAQFPGQPLVQGRLSAGA